MKRQWKTERKAGTSDMRCIGWIFLVAGFFPVSGQEADTNDAIEIWTRMNVRLTTRKNLQHDFEFQYRNQQRVAALQERLSLYTFRWYIQKRWNNFFIQSSPVTFFERRARDNNWINEFRLTQLAGWFLFDNNMQIRTGLEGRFFWTNDTSFEEVRWRTRVLVFIPLSSAVKLQLADEVFLHERTSGPEVPFFDQNRVMLGISYKVSQHWTVDAGYQYQTRSFAREKYDNFNVFYLYLIYQI